VAPTEQRWRAALTAVARVAAGLVLAAAPRPAHADGASDDAKKHFFAGQAFYEAGRYAEAISEFVAANDIKAHPAFLYNIAVSYKMLDNNAKALDYVEKYLAVVTDPADKERAKAMEAELKAAKAPPASGPAMVPTPGGAPGPAAAPKKKEETKKILEVVSTPPGAALWIDRKEGEPRTRTPAIIEMPAGEHAVFLELEEYGPMTRKVEVDPAKPWVVLDINLVKKESLGFATIVSDQPGTAVFVDSRDAGAVGYTPYKDWISIGKHHLWLEKEGFETVEADVDVASGDTPTFKYEMKIANYGRLEMSANVPGAVVEVDGAVLSTVPGPTPAPKLSTGAHTLRLYAPGHKPWRTDIVIENGKTLSLKGDLVKRPSIAGPIVFFALGIGFGITGTVYANKAKKLIDALNAEVDAKELVDASDPRRRKARIDAIVGDAGWGLGAIFVIAGVIDLVYDPTPPSTGKVVGSSFAAAPLPGGGAMLSFRGEF
jgi:outer membrane receptor for ferrienterochelin and colicins